MKRVAGRDPGWCRRQIPLGYSEQRREAEERSDALVF